MAYYFHAWKHIAINFHEHLINLLLMAIGNHYQKKEKEKRN